MVDFLAIFRRARKLLRQPVQYDADIAPPFGLAGFAVAVGLVPVR